MSINLSSTTPAAPANNSNVTFQVDGSGNVSAYLPTAPMNVAAIDLTAQTGTLTTQALFTPAATAFYKVAFYAKITTTGTSPVIGPLSIQFQDGADSVSQNITVSGTTEAGVTQATGNNGNATTTVLQGEARIWAKTGVAVTYTFTTTGTFGPAQYELHIRVTQQ